MISVAFNQLPGFSKLFIDFINNDNFFNERFPNNKIINNFDFSKIQYNIKQREILISSIKKNYELIGLNDIQNKNLELLKKENTYTITTGQQIGFLGGPLFTFYKIITTLKYVKELKLKYPERDFIPIFWLEDNDHDKVEASTSYIFNKSKSILKVKSIEKYDLKDKTITSYLENSDYTISQINSIFDELSYYEHSPKIKEYFLDIYKIKTQKDSFIRLTNDIFKDFGLLIVSADCLRINGAFEELVKKEIYNSGLTSNLISIANSIISSYNYPLQAKESEINLFYHIYQKRFKIKIENDSYKIDDKLFNYKELVELADKDFKAFSPNVLLRPVFQDYSLPSILYVAGPGEIGYWTQLKELYNFFNVNMSIVVPRHSITIIPRKFKKNYDKLENDFKFYLCSKESIDKYIYEKYHSKLVNEKIEFTNKIISNAFKELGDFASDIEKTLLQSVVTSHHKVNHILENLEKKLNSAYNKRNQEDISKYYDLHSLIYPHNTLQERIFALVNLINYYDFNGLQEIIYKLLDVDNFYHNVIFTDL